MMEPISPVASPLPRATHHHIQPPGYTAPEVNTSYQILVVSDIGFIHPIRVMAENPHPRLYSENMYFFQFVCGLAPFSGAGRCPGCPIRFLHQDITRFLFQVKTVLKKCSLGAPVLMMPLLLGQTIPSSGLVIPTPTVKYRQNTVANQRSPSCYEHMQKTEKTPKI